MSVSNKPYQPKHGSKPDLFLELAKPDKDGLSRKVWICEFEGKYEDLRMGNGGDWCRDDGALGKHYNIERHKEKGKIVYVRLHGYKKLPIDKPIPENIRKQINPLSCAVLAISNVEVDHKDGRRDDPRLSDASQVTIEDFQPLSRAVNVAKRQHCRTCRETDQRFDAKRLGYSVSQVKGNGTYRGTCLGCYWHDPALFNKMVSAGYTEDT